MASVTVVIILGTLGVTGSYHIRNVGHFREIIDAHALIPRSLSGAAAVGLAVGEVGIISLTSFGVLADTSSIVRVGMSAAAVLLTVILLYVWRVFSLRGSVACGCSPSDTALGPWSIIRASVLVALAVTGAVLSSHFARPELSVQWAIILSAALCLGVSIWRLPDALDALSLDLSEGFSIRDVA